MSKQRIYYRRTTASQRQRAFEVWEETKNVGEACRQARISKSTFYYWKGRYKAKGKKGIEEAKKPGPEKGVRISQEIEEKVVKLKTANPEWGKRRIADEISKENSWVPLVSVNTVRRILEERGMWAGIVKGVEKN